jgi:hypothetical protein
MMKVKKRVRYSLAILAPGDDPEKELMRVSSDKPFRNVHVGDEVLPRRWLWGRDAPEQTLAGMLLRVTKLRHVVGDCDYLIDHVVVVFTEDISPEKPAPPKKPRRRRAA